MRLHARIVSLDELDACLDRLQSASGPVQNGRPSCALYALVASPLRKRALLMVHLCVGGVGARALEARL